MSLDIIIDFSIVLTRCDKPSAKSTTTHKYMHTENSV